MTKFEQIKKILECGHMVNVLIQSKFDQRTTATLTAIHRDNYGHETFLFSEGKTGEIVGLSSNYYNIVLDELEGFRRKRDGNIGKKVFSVPFHCVAPYFE